MARENDDQLDVIRSIKAEGGYAKKWAARFGVGNPDLICSLPDIGIFLLEVKTPKNSEPTGIQKYELEQWKKAGGLALVGIVVRKVSLVLLAPVVSLPCFWNSKQRIYTDIKQQMKNYREVEQKRTLYNATMSRLG